MADHTKIEWTDATWNPITGCTVHSAGCTNCYAMRLAGTRLKHHPSRAGLTTDTKAGPVWNGKVRFNEEWLTQPLSWTRPRMIFVCAHGDLFHEDVPDEWIDRVFAVMAMATRHRFQVLTKRAERMRAYIARFDDRDWIGNLLDLMDEIGTMPGYWGGSAEFAQWPLPNVWLGVSVEDQRAADERVPHLLATPAAVRWLSCEPLLGPVDLHFERGWCRACNSVTSGRIDGHCMDPASACFAGETTIDAMLHWIVAGGESGRGARPMHPDWARSLRDQCAAADVPFLFKQWGAWAPLKACRDPDHLYLTTKKAAGRLLDGVQHDGFPA